jgi:hypothetical protein
MGLGQTMLTTMFLVLLTLAVISANRLILDRQTSFYEQEAYKQSAILANELLQEIVRKKFDGKIDTSSSVYLPLNTTNFSSPSELGPSPTARSYVNPGGAADTIPYKSIKNTDDNFFDDIDDYKGYKRSASAGGLTGFILTVNVYYVALSNLDVDANALRYRKRIDVTVSNSKYLKKDLLYSTIVAY